MPTLNSLNSGKPKRLAVGNPELSRIDEMVTGTILGDGHISQDGCLSIEHGIKQQSYVYWKYDYLKHLCNLPPKITHHGNAIRFRTKALFKDERQKWYGTGRKALPDDFESIITPFVLAVWFMDDGDCKKGTHKGKTVDFLMDNGMRLSIHNFNRKEAGRIVNVFSKFEIEAYYRREGKYLRLSIPARNENSKKFADLILPYMTESMKYKIPAFRENMRGKHGNQWINRIPESAETKQGTLNV